MNAFLTAWLADLLSIFCFSGFSNENYPTFERLQIDPSEFEEIDDVTSTKREA